MLGRVFVATLRDCPEAFKCPLCGDNPDYVIIDGQCLGFRKRPNMSIVRPAQLRPMMPVNVDLLCVLPTATLRRAVRKVLRCSDSWNKSEMAAVRQWAAAKSGTRRRMRKRGRVKREILLPAAQL